MREPLEIVIVMEGGLVQDVHSCLPIRVTVVDYDIEGLQPEDLQQIPRQLQEGTEPAYVHELDPLYRTAWLLKFLDWLWASGFRNAGCDWCGTNDRMPGERVCKDCKADSEPFIRFEGKTPE